MIGFIGTRSVALVLIACATLPCIWGEATAKRVAPEAAGSLRFVSGQLADPAPPGSLRTVRTVHPSLTRISGWISSVGAATALADLDGDGCPDDVCLVDPRSDSVWICPVPGTGDYPAIVLPQPVELFDPALMAPMGVLILDLDRDGWQDLLVYYWGRTPLAFIRDPARSLSDPEAWKTERCVASEDRWYTNAATAADVDGDGMIDVLIGNYFADGARILDSAAQGEEEMQSSMSRASNGGGLRLLRRRSRDEVDFEVTGPVGGSEARGWVLAIAAGDLDDDLLPEVYVANDFGPDFLLHNRSRPRSPRLFPTIGSRGLTEPASHVMGLDSFKGMGAEFADVDADGVSEILVSNITTPYGLHESNFLFRRTTSDAELKAGLSRGEAHYRNEAEALGLARSGWGWDVKVADLDNDGVVEVLQATGFLRGERNRWPELQELATCNDHVLPHPYAWPTFMPGDDLSGHCVNPVFRRSNAAEAFRNVADLVGLGQQRVTRGIALGDVDCDGLMDFVLANQWAPAEYVRNVSESGGEFLGLVLLRPLDDNAQFLIRPGRPGADTPGSPAIGAVAEFQLGQRSFRGEIDGGNGHSGKRAPELHFGLGLGAPGSLSVKLRWRDTHGVPSTTVVTVSSGWNTVVLGNPPSRSAQ